MIKKTLLAILLIGSLPSTVSARDDLEDICKKDTLHGEKGRLISNVKIANYTVSTVWPEISTNWEPAIQVAVWTGKNDQGKWVKEWFGIYWGSLYGGDGGEGIMPVAQTMALLNRPVNICVIGKYLRGIENAENWQ